MGRAGSLALVLLTAAAPQSQTPEQYVRGLYASFYGARDDGGALGMNTDRFFSKTMLNLITRDRRANAPAGGGVGVLDSDPICDCQDDSGLRLRRLEVTPVDATHALAKVRLNFSDGGRIVLKLIHENRGWRIEDVKDDDQPWLTKLLADEIRSLRPTPRR